MKSSLSLFSFLLAANLMIAQSNCLPDTTVLDSILFIDPAPFDIEASPMGGIRDTACVGRPFEFTFTILTPSTISSSGLTLPVTSFDMATQGGLNYEPPLADFNNTIAFDGSALPSGIYVMILANNLASLSRKLIVHKN